ncbi:unnamed protein product [Tuber melanosporum]|jgi:hypothetical protein|uniref:(Perigord truffle) hypothetical protein n=1 Tax=Tuber melanosporum (strain Mel28) TaxID=656061 RepID=D5GED1_TUBMM|nr:uncharacterized protein GSTUM_00001272001 [Tuber melanosporum]CAZ82874.1 unnamed protein product [Tuber melanosporum]
MNSILRQRATEGETVRSVVIFSRHGDRTPKILGTTRLTALGKNQVYASGEFYRARYLDSNSTHFIKGISGRKYVEKEVFASSPDQQLLVQSTQVFLQGLYPPQNVMETLADGTSVSTPANGQQYPVLHSVSSNSPDAIWLKGDDGCPAHDQSFENFYASQQFKDLSVSTKPFYESFADLLEGVIPQSKVNYKSAFTIFDYLNVGRIYNSTIAKRVSSEDLAKLKYLADSTEWALNANITAAIPNPISISGSTLAKAILTQLSPSVTTPSSAPKLSVLFGSYDTFLSFFSLASLPSASSSFYGLPEYASTMVFELVSHPSDSSMYIRFLFRNGTRPESPLTEYPLFGQGGQNALMPYTEFAGSMDKIAIDNLDQWCKVCDSQEDICQARSMHIDIQPTGRPSMKPELAGGVGALCALAAVGIISAALMMIMGFRFTKKEKKAEVARSCASTEGSVDVKA